MTTILESIDADNKNDCNDIDDYFSGTADQDLVDKSGKEKEKGNDKIIRENEKDIVIGIDLGTVNTCVSVWRNGNVEIIPDQFGNNTIPSVVAFTSRSKYVGLEAKNQIEINPTGTFYEVKRLIGRKYADETVQNDLQFMTFGIDKDNQDNVILMAGNKKYHPEQISGYILSEAKMMAELYLKQNISKAVITVPAYFNDAQRQATKDAAQIAGLDCLRIINEPTAAALAYGLMEKSIMNKRDMNVIVYDLGGGTLDISLLNISNGVFEVLGSAGNTHLGGTDFDNRLINHAMNEFKKKYKIDKLDLSSISFQKLKNACEKGKKLLSVNDATVISVKDFYDDKNLVVKITRKQMDSICKDLFILCLKPLDDVLEGCSMDKSAIDEIILVGGGTRMPTIRENIKLYFNKEPNISVNPDEVVAAGAGIQGYILENGTDVFSENVVLLDIIPLSLGVETIGGVMNVLIPRNSIIPYKKKKRYTTDTDYESSVTIKIYEGERKMTKDNFYVGEFELNDIEPAPRGVAQIDITFSVDVNGIVSVSAEDIKNHNKKEIKIKGNKGHLTPSEIEQLVEDAKEFELKDKLEREKKQMFYEIEDLCSNIRINVQNNEFRLKENDKIMVMKDVDQITDWLKEMVYSDRQRGDYEKVIRKLKEKYGTLILKISHGNDVKTLDKKTDAVSVYCDDDNDDDINNLLVDDIDIIDNSTDISKEDKKELLELRNCLVDMCYKIFDIISDDNINIDKDHIDELKEYVDDILLWVHVKEKISVAEYKQKIDEINKVCDDTVSKNENIFSKNENISKKNELEYICCNLLANLSTIITASESDLILLKKTLNDTLDWLIDIEIANNCPIIDDNIFQNKIDMINDMCSKIYESSVSVRIDNKIDIIQPDINLNLNINNDSGMTISQLKNIKKNQ